MLATLSFNNQMIQFAFLQAVYIAFIGFLGAWAGIALYFLQAVAAIFMLETTSYIEHYGLLRDKRPDGKYEPMSPANSWDCYGRFSNYLVFQLQRHADHQLSPPAVREFADGFRSTQTACRLSAVDRYRHVSPAVAKSHGLSSQIVESQKVG